jgi:hypothetical protein
LGEALINAISATADTGTGTDIDTDIIDIDNIPDTLTNAHIDFNDAVGVGYFVDLSHTVDHLQRQLLGNPAQKDGGCLQIFFANF